MLSRSYKVVLVDYDDDLFTPPGNEAKLLAEAGAAWYAGQHRTHEEIIPHVQQADIVMIQSVRPLLNREVIRQMERCRCIVKVSIGYDNIDVKSATEKGIWVCNVPLYCVDDVAEHALALLLDGVRHVAFQDRWIRAGKWDRRGAKPARRVRGSTLGLVSFGRIARGLAQRAQGFGVQILAFDPYVSAPEMEVCGVEKVDLDGLLTRSDLISVHAPLTEATHHLLGREELERVKPGAVLVNTSRGPVVDNEALADALKSGRLWAAGLDVMEQEPLPAESALRQLDNVTFTPHVGASTDQSKADLYRTACEIACEVLAGRRPASVVNPEVKPWFEHG